MRCCISVSLPPMEEQNALLALYIYLMVIQLLALYSFRNHTQHKCVPRMSSTAAATLNTATFTFAAPNRCRGTEENTAPKREKREQRKCTKMDVVLFKKKKKTAFKVRKKPGVVLPFLKNAGCT